MPIPDSRAPLLQVSGEDVCSLAWEPAFLTRCSVDSVSLPELEMSGRNAFTPILQMWQCNLKTIVGQVDCETSVTLQCEY